MAPVVVSFQCKKSGSFQREGLRRHAPCPPCEFFLPTSAPGARGPRRHGEALKPNQQSLDNKYGLPLSGTVCRVAAQVGTSLYQFLWDISNGVI
jgi:hypothetical protein